MTDDADLECTCDIGPFSSCPVCRSRPVETQESAVPRKKRKWEQQSAEARIAEIKGGYLK
ncbi:hypothetical protein P67b_00055 [Ruegeria phage Tedan]|nr:hypothetical protein P67b_00055 [Ruegeria phage Tedan]